MPHSQTLLCLTLPLCFILDPCLTAAEPAENLSREYHVTPVPFKWNEPHELSGVQVYWFDDSDRGACHLPEAWRILYRDATGQFQPVTNRGQYGTEKDKFNPVRFEPVRTRAVKLKIDLQEEWSAGIQEVVIE